jgi:hypothetical protein
MIIVTYINYDVNFFKGFEYVTDTDNITGVECSGGQLTQLPDNINWPNLLKFHCHNNFITHLPENISCPNLQEFICKNNLITNLPNKMQCPNLIRFDCSQNKLTHIPDMQSCDLPNLEVFDCSNNKLTQLSNIVNLPKLIRIDCSRNKLTHLPVNINWSKLLSFHCDNNKLTYLPDDINSNSLYSFSCSSNLITQLPVNINCPNLIFLVCNNNQLTHLPLSIMNSTSLTYITYSNNPIELSPQIARFINRINNVQTDQFNVYTDGQNVHDSNIQLCVKDSINALTTRSGIGAYNKIQLIETIMTDPVLTCKDQLIEYLEDETVHSLLLLTWGEVLWAVLKTIELDFNIEQQIEIKLILNQEMDDAQCKCFTGRLCRVVNCLNGFSPLVNINIKDSDQIGNIILLIKSQLADNYDVETHKQLVKQELESRGFDDHVIDEWIGYIE